MHRGVDKGIKNLAHILAPFLEWVYIELQFVSMWNLINLALNQISFYEIIGPGEMMMDERVGVEESRGSRGPLTWWWVVQPCWLGARSDHCPAGTGLVVRDQELADSAVCRKAWGPVVPHSELA